MSVSHSYTDKDYWDRFFSGQPRKVVDAAPFADVFEKFLIKDNQKTVLEVGCAGGEFLCHIAKHFKYRAHGIDFSDEIDTTGRMFAYNGLPAPVLYREDFFSWNSRFQFDLVCSFGFAEHFDDLSLVVKKHADHVAPGGKLILSVPNFSKLQYVFHLLVEPQSLKHHNLKIMNLKAFQRAFEPLTFQILHLSYYGAFGFWTVKKPDNAWSRWWAGLIKRSGKTWKRIFRHKPNRWVSPHIICVAQKPAE
ncbi:class I SAM-dependent methyltransferase [Fibrobacterota bacterium]